MEVVARRGGWSPPAPPLDPPLLIWMVWTRPCTRTSPVATQVSGGGGLLGSAPGGGGGSGVRQHRAAARVLASDVQEIEGD